MAPRTSPDRRSMASRGFAVGGALVLALALLPSAAFVAPDDALAGTARVGPFGTATIDGVQAPGEWDAAAAVPFQITKSPAAGGTRTDATLFLMNDARNVYVAVRVAAVLDHLTTNMSFDRDHDGETEPGDDRLEVELPRTVTTASVLPLRDRFWGRCSTGQCFTWLDDTQSGWGNPPAGTTDGRAAGAFDLTSGYIELVHPLASADTSHDLHVSPGAVVGFRLDASIVTGGTYGGSGMVPAQDCLERPCRSEYADLVITTGRARITTPQEVVSAIRIEVLAVAPSAALPGATLKATFKVVNRSDRTLVVPLDPSGWYLGGWLERWLERLGPDPSIGARSATGSVKLETEPIDVLARLGGTSWPPGASITFAGSASEVGTRGHPPGDYRYTVRRYAQPSYGAPAQTSVTQFALKGVTDEWHASVGAGGRNGAATLRAWSTDDGSLGLTLRGLSPRSSYQVAVRSGSCSGPIVTSAGTVTANASGAVTKTLTLSRAKTSAILATAARGRLVLRIGSGSPARCGTLARVPIYQASLVWRVRQLPGIESDPPIDGSGAAPIGIVATATGLVAAGYHRKNDCTRESSGGWSCRPPTRQATAVWTSADGYTWTEQILGADTGPGIVAAGSGRVVVVANGAAWWSLDGRTWTPSSRPPAGRVERYWGSGFGVVTATGAGFMAIMPTQAGPAGCRSAAWTSADGSSWDQLPYDPDLACLGAHDLLVDPSRVVAVGSDPESDAAAIAISPDRGATWERATISRFPSAARRITTVVATAAGYVAYGTLDSGGIGVWTSTDGHTWRAAASVAAFSWYDSSWVADAVAFGPGYVLVGGSQASVDDLIGCVLVSGDGTTLRWAPWPPATGGATMAAAAAWNNRLYVVGTQYSWFDHNSPHVWTAELGAMP